MVEEPEVVVHEADQPDFFIDLLAKTVERLILRVGEAHTTAHSDGHRAIVERVLKWLLAVMVIVGSSVTGKC